MLQVDVFYDDGGLANAVSEAAPPRAINDDTCLVSEIILH